MFFISVFLIISVWCGSKIVHPIPEDIQKNMVKHHTWREGCPVPLSDLSLIDEISFVDFDGNLHNDGQVIMHKLRVQEIQGYLDNLLKEKFPIRSFVLMYHFDGNDTQSMDQDNSSGFNCRHIGGTSKWSNHAYGCAIDLNTVENPYYNPTEHEISPEKGAEFLNRTDVRPGMIVLDDFVYDMFHQDNWTWGGNWERSPMYWDWQHFEKPLSDEERLI